MKILGTVGVRRMLYIGLTEVLVTIILCYVMAVTLQHKPAWLPTISECGELSPEKHFFRWGIMLGGLLLAVEAVVLWIPMMISTLVFAVGLIAGLALTGVAVVASNENLPVHLVFAWTFFGLEDLMILLMLLEGFHSFSHSSLALKCPSVILAISATAGRLLVTSGTVTLPENDVPWLAIFEWVNVLAVLGYHLSMAKDVTILEVAELR